MHVTFTAKHRDLYAGDYLVVLRRFVSVKSGKRTLPADAPAVPADFAPFGSHPVLLECEHADSPWVALLDPSDGTYRLRCTHRPNHVWTVTDPKQIVVVAEWWRLRRASWRRFERRSPGFPVITRGVQL